LVPRPNYRRYGCYIYSDRQRYATANNEFLIIAALNYDQGSSLTLNGGFTISNSIDHSGSNYFVSGMAYLVQSTAAAVDPTFTWTGFGDPSAVIASYK
jgi:hypothetical protein